MKFLHYFQIALVFFTNMMYQNYYESVRVLRDLWFWFKLSRKWVVTCFLNIMNKGFKRELMHISLLLSMFTASRASCGKLRSPDVCFIGNSYFFANRRNAQRDCMGNHMHQSSLKIQPFRMVRVKKPSVCSLRKFDLCLLFVQANKLWIICVFSYVYSMTSLPILGSRLFTSTPLINSADLVTDIREFIKRFFTTLKFTLPTLRLLPSTSVKCRLCSSSVCDVLNFDFLKSSFLK